MREQYRELVAADAGDRSALADAAAQYVGDRDDDLVAQQVSVGIVDRLEIVDVQHHQAAASQTVTFQAHELLVESAAVQQRRERIALRETLRHLEFPAQSLDLERAAPQVLVKLFGGGVHARGIGDKRVHDPVERLAAEPALETAAVLAELG